MTTAVLTVAGCLLAIGGPTAAAGRTDAAPPPQPQIVGGTVAAPGSWPAQAGLLAHRSATGSHPFCGATVVSPSWILTAAHCVTTGADEPVDPADLDVLTGTQDVTTGGQRRRAAEVRIAPGFVAETLQDDLALVRLDRPTSAPHMVPAAAGTIVAPGTDLVTAGWGARSADGTSFPDDLHEVHVDAVSDAACAAAYPVLPDKFFASSMVCAGDLAVGGRDSCNGDSGGPLAATVAGQAVQVGIVSWGIGCAEVGNPGVYTRVSAFRGWIDAQKRFGPHPGAAAYVVQLSRDATGRPPTLPELFVAVDQLTTVSAADWSALRLHELWKPTGGLVQRLYRAAFQRDVDAAGLSYWLERMRAGTSGDAVASSLAASEEFRRTYGALTNADFVATLYERVLGRPADGDGAAFWTAQLDQGRMSRGRVLRGFAAAPELTAAVGARLEVTAAFFVLVRRLPTAAELAVWTPRPADELLASLLGSVSYAARF